MYKALLRPILFLLPPEKAHALFVFYSKLPLVYAFNNAFFTQRHPSLETTVAGIKFPNPVGLAAGFDKNALLLNEISMFGFGFTEVGTITPEPQPGNPLPRLFRLPVDRALINRMGFNNDGVIAIAKRLEKRKTSIIVGANIGKNRNTPLENAKDDYLECFIVLSGLADYFTVNVSSPNTPGLRKLQEKENLLRLLAAIQDKNRQQSKAKPIFIKISPDLTRQELDDIITVSLQTGISGIIATNTTTETANLITASSRLQKIGEGGVSGKPLAARSTELIKTIKATVGDKMAVIGSGGIFSYADAMEKFNAGASLVQLYTGFVYEGPGLVKAIYERILNGRKSTGHR